MERERHLSFETMEKFIEGKLRGDQLSATEEHISVCAECARKIYTLRDFPSLWDEWTAKTHGEAYLRADKKRLSDIRKRLSEIKTEALIGG